LIEREGEILSFILNYVMRGRESEEKNQLSRERDRRYAWTTQIICKKVGVLGFVKMDIPGGPDVQTVISRSREVK
jgi:hypothetical protein